MTTKPVEYETYILRLVAQLRELDEPCVKEAIKVLEELVAWQVVSQKEVIAYHKELAKLKESGYGSRS